LELTDAARNTYEVPFDKPVTVIPLLVVAVCAKEVHDDPEFDEYWIS
jgi:hypothetical protein